MFSDHNRHLSTEGIDGASPSKFKHKGKKLFVDKKEILSVFGGKVGRYHGFQNDFKVGGTYESESFDRFYIDKQKRDFQIKKRINGYSDSQTFSIGNGTIEDGTLNNMKSPEYKSKMFQQKYLNYNASPSTDKLPKLRESTSSKLLTRNDDDIMSIKTKLQRYKAMNIAEDPYTNVPSINKSYR